MYLTPHNSSNSNFYIDHTCRSIHLIPTEWLNEIFVLITTDLSQRQGHFNELWSFSRNPAASNTNYITGDGLFTPESMNLWVIFWTPHARKLFQENFKDCANDTFVPLLFLCKRAKTFDSTQRVITWGMTSSAHRNQPTAQLMLYCPCPYSLTDPIPSLHLCFSWLLLASVVPALVSLAPSSCPCRTLQKLFRFPNARKAAEYRNTLIYSHFHRCRVSAPSRGSACGPDPSCSGGWTPLL